MVAVLYVSLFRRTSSKPESYSHSLRHVEYYRGILFLTTNRITAFDEAFLSRIHVALHFSGLTRETKAKIWRAFLKKAGLGDAELNERLVAQLAERDVNGRQIKNACRTAKSLALSRNEPLGFAHLAETMDAMDDGETSVGRSKAESEGGRGLHAGVGGLCTGTGRDDEGVERRLLDVTGGVSTCMVSVAVIAEERLRER